MKSVSRLGSESGHRLKQSDFSQPWEIVIDARSPTKISTADNAFLKRGKVFFDFFKVCEFCELHRFVLAKDMLRKCLVSMIIVLGPNFHDFCSFLPNFGM